MWNNCECECEEERKSLKASSMQLTSTRNVQFGFACKVPLTRFNFLANFQSWGINLNSSCIIPILSICRGRQESASGPGYGNKNVDRSRSGWWLDFLKLFFSLHSSLWRWNVWWWAVVGREAINMLSGTRSWLKQSRDCRNCEQLSSGPLWVLLSLNNELLVVICHGHKVNSIQHTTRLAHL